MCGIKRDAHKEMTTIRCFKCEKFQSKNRSNTNIPFSARLEKWRKKRSRFYFYSLYWIPAFQVAPSYFRKRWKFHFSFENQTEKNSNPRSNRIYALQKLEENKQMNTQKQMNYYLKRNGGVFGNLLPQIQ